MIKTTPRQKLLLTDMLKGVTVKWLGDSLISNGNGVRALLHKSTVKSLYQKELIELIDLKRPQYTLTKLGKSVASELNKK